MDVLGLSSNVWMDNGDHGTTGAIPMLTAEESRLTELPAALREAGYIGVPPYRKITEYAVNCRIQVYSRNNYWFWKRERLHEIAAALNCGRATATDREAA
jgi:hypothetical protein